MSIMDADEALGFPTEYFDEIDSYNSGDYVAFLFEGEDPTGIFTGDDLDKLMTYVNAHATEGDKRYMIVKVIHSHAGETIH